MARVKLYESDAKRLLFPDQPVLKATSATSSGEIKKKFGNIPLVVKVDQGVKKRGKQGLVAVGLDAVGVVGKIREWSDTWSFFIVEPAVAHSPYEEKYLSCERARDGWRVLESDKGGIEIEKDWDQVKPVDPAKYTELLGMLDTYHIAFLELNPYLIQDGRMYVLDAAAEIDDAALGLAEVAPRGIEPVSDRAQTASEKAVVDLDSSTPASLKFRLINPDGAIWMLLSGGGASLVLADEVADRGYGDELANYGEYSGSPTDDDTYSYARIILKQMLAAKKSKKALVIAGGVANFTDVAKTFRGLIRALDEVKEKLGKAQVKVFVRRGGPNEKNGLAMMEKFLNQTGLLGSIHGHSVPLTQVVSEVGEYLQ